MGEPAVLPTAGWEARRLWERRPALAGAVRLLVLVVPVLVAIGTSILLSHVLPRPEEWWQLALWWITILAGTFCVMVLADLGCRRALPLAALFELSLLFPDRAPARFRVWRRGGSVHQLRAELEALSQDTRGQGPEAAQRVLTLVAALAVHDSRTRGHAERVRVLTDMIAEEMHLPDSDRHLLRWASLLHDIGKLEVPGEVLRKPGPPDDVEWETLRRHPEEGDRLLGAVKQWLGPWAPTVEHHHEHYDGTGYPRGLRGEEISLGGRIVGLADAFEAMTARRPYNRPVSPVAAREELVRRAGTQFDPDVCRAFLSISLGRLWRVAGFAAGLAQIPLVGSFIGTSTRVVSRTTSTGSATVAAGALAVAVGFVQVTGVEHSVAGPRSGVAGVHAPQQVVPSPPIPPPVVLPGGSLLIQAPPAPPAPAPAATPAPIRVAPVAATAVHNTRPTPAPAGATATTVSISLRPGSVHRNSLFSAAGTLSSCPGCTVTVDYGDGSGVTTVPVSDGSFTLSHRYTGKGRDVLTVTAWSGGVAAGSTSRRLVIDNGDTPAF